MIPGEIVATGVPGVGLAGGHVADVDAPAHLALRVVLSPEAWRVRLSKAMRSPTCGGSGWGCDIPMHISIPHSKFPVQVLLSKARNVHLEFLSAIRRLLLNRGSMCE